MQSSEGSFNTKYPRKPNGITDPEYSIECGVQCGYLESGVMPKFSLCSDGVKWFQGKGQFKDGSYVPATGDIIFLIGEMTGVLTMWELWRAWAREQCIRLRETAGIA